MMPGETRARPSAVRMVAAPYPVDTFCSNCGKVVVTVVEHEPGTCTYLSISVPVVRVDCTLHLHLPVLYRTRIHRVSRLNESRQVEYIQYNTIQIEFVKRHNRSAEALVGWL